MKSSTLFFLFCLSAGPAMAADKAPDCAGPDRWPASSAFGTLKNAGLINNSNWDYAKTKVERIASEEIAKGLYRQIHHITYSLKKGPPLKVLTVSDSSREECSMGDVQIFVLSRTLGKSPDTKEEVSSMLPVKTR